MLTATYPYELFIRARPSCKLVRLQNVEVTCLSRRRNRNEDMDTGKGKMTVQEAGKRGGAKGGPRVRELVEEGREHENE